MSSRRLSAAIAGSFLLFAAAGTPADVADVADVADMTEPRLRFYLARPAAKGHLALSSFLPAGGPEDMPMARFTNLSVRPGDVDPSPPFVAEVSEAPAGRVSKWLLSPAFAATDGTVREAPAELLAGAGWEVTPVIALDGVGEVFAGPGRRGEQGQQQRGG